MKTFLANYLIKHIYSAVNVGKKTDFLLPFTMKKLHFCLNFSIFDYWSLQKVGCWLSDGNASDTMTDTNRQPTTDDL